MDEANNFPSASEIQGLLSENEDLRVNLEKSKKAKKRLKKKFAKKASKKFKKFYGDFFNSIEHAVYKVNRKGEIVFFNERFIELFQIDKSTLAENFDHSILPQTIRKKFRSQDAKVLNKGKKLFSNDFLINPTTKKEIHFEAVRLPLFTKKGKISGVHVSILDITSKVIDEKKYSYINTLKDIITHWSIEFASSKIHSQYEIISKALTEIGEACSVDRVYIFEHNYKNQTTSNTFEWCAEGISAEIDNLQNLPLELIADWIELHSKGSNVNIPDVSKLKKESTREVLESQNIKSLLAIPIMVENESVGFIGFDSVKDLKTWNDDEVKLLKVLSSLLSILYSQKHSEHGYNLLSQAISQTGNVIIITDSNGIIEYVNPAFEKLTGYKSFEVLGKTPSILKSDIHPVSFYEEVWNTIKDGKVWAGEILNRAKNGSLFWEFITISPINDSEGNLTNFISVHENITNKKNSEQALLESDAKYRSLVDKIHEGIIFVDNHDVIIFVNNAFAKTLGYEAEELIGKKSIEVLFADETRNEIYTRTRKRFEGISEQYDTEMVKKTGEKVFVSVSASPVYNKAKDITGSMAICSDITVRRKSEIALKESEERFRGYINYAPLAIFVADENGKYVEVNKAAQSLLGYTESELLAMYVKDVLPEDFLEAGFDHFLKVISSGYADGEFVHLKKDKTRIWVSVVAIKVSDSRLMAFAQDITYRKNTEEALTLSENRYRTIVEGLSIGIAIHQDNKIIYVNPILTELIEALSPDDLIGRNVLDFVHEHDRPIVQSAIQESLKTKNTRWNHPQIIEERLITFSGKEINVEASAIIIEYNNRDALMVMINDVTEKVKAEQEIKKRRADLESLFNNTTDSIWSIDKEYRIISINNVFQKSFEIAYGVQLLPGMRITDYLPPMISSEWISRYDRALSGERFSIVDNFEYEGLPNYVETSFNPILVDDNIIGFSCFARDITESCLNDEKLIKTHEIYAQVLKTIKGVPYIHNYETDTYDFIGHGCEDLLGIPQEEMNITRLREVIKENILNLPPEIDNAYLAKELMIEKKINHYSADIRIITPSGEEKWLSDNSIPLIDESSGEVKGDIGILIDITDRKKSESAIKDNEERLRTLINAMPDIVCFKDAEGRWLIANEFDINLFGLNGVDYKGKKDSDLAIYSNFYKEAFLTCEASDEAAWNKREPSRCDEIIPRPDGTEMTFDIIKVPIFNEDGSRKGLIVVGRDITQRRTTEKALIESEGRFRSLLQNVGSVAVQGYNSDGTVIYWNDASESFYGFSKEEALGKSLLDLIIPDFLREDVKLAVDEMIATGISRDSEELRLLHKDGSYVDVLSSHVVVNIPGKGTELYCIDVDLSNIRAAEKSLLESEERYRNFIRHSSEGIYRIEIDQPLDTSLTLEEQIKNIVEFGFLAECNDAYARMYGFDSSKDLVGLRLVDAFNPNIEKNLETLTNFIKSGYKLNLAETKEVKRDGTVIFLENNLVGFVENDTISRCWGIQKDITERKASQEKLLATLREKEALIHELYHRTKNNMQVIAAMLTLQASLKGSPDIIKSYEDMGMRIKSMSLVHQLLYESRNLSEVNLKSYITSLAELLRNNYAVDKSSFVFEFNMYDVFVTIDYGIPLGLVINELIINAIKYAFPSNEKNKIIINLNRKADNEINVSIHDTGKGFPAGFTPRDSKSLGMQLIFGIVENQLNGSVTFTHDSGIKCEVKFIDNIYTRTL